METVSLHDTPILVTYTLGTASPIVSTIGPSASIILLNASMHREDCGDAVDVAPINLNAARSILARSNIGTKLKCYSFPCIDAKHGEQGDKWIRAPTDHGDDLRSPHLDRITESLSSFVQH